MTRSLLNSLIGRDLTKREYIEKEEQKDVKISMEKLYVTSADADIAVDPASGKIASSSSGLPNTEISENGDAVIDQPDIADNRDVRDEEVFPKAEKEKESLQTQESSENYESSFGNPPDIDFSKATVASLSNNEEGVKDAVEEYAINEKDITDFEEQTVVEENSVKVNDMTIDKKEKQALMAELAEVQDAMLDEARDTGALEFFEEPELEISGDKNGNVDMTLVLNEEIEEILPENPTPDELSVEKESIEKVSAEKTSFDESKDDLVGSEKEMLENPAPDELSVEKESIEKVSAEKTSFDESKDDLVGSEKEMLENPAPDELSVEKESIEKVSAEKTSFDESKDENLVGSEKEMLDGVSAELEYTEAFDTSVVPEKGILEEVVAEKRTLDEISEENDFHNPSVQVDEKDDLKAFDKETFEEVSAGKEDLDTSVHFAEKEHVEEAYHEEETFGASIDAKMENFEEELAEKESSRETSVEKESFDEMLPKEEAIDASIIAKEEILDKIELEKDVVEEILTEKDSHEGLLASAPVKANSNGEILEQKEDPMEALEAKETSDEGVQEKEPIFTAVVNSEDLLYDAIKEETKDEESKDTSEKEALLSESRPSIEPMSLMTTDDHLIKESESVLETQQPDAIISEPEELEHAEDLKFEDEKGDEIEVDGRSDEDRHVVGLNVASGSIFAQKSEQFEVDDGEIKRLASIVKTSIPAMQARAVVLAAQKVHEGEISSQSDENL